MPPAAITSTPRPPTARRVGSPCRGSLLGPYLRALRLVAVLLAVLVPRFAWADDPVVWQDRDSAGALQTHLYFFWSPSCPHCQQARPIVEDLADRTPWLVLHSHDVITDEASRDLYVRLAESLGDTARYVPAFAYCGTLAQGFPGGEPLERGLRECHARGAEHGQAVTTTTTTTTTVELPLAGQVDLRRWSLPLTTIVLAGLDAFNPCSFFVLLFLLSLLVRTRSRARMLVISGIFVLFSGLWYFVFMAAWLNIFLWIGELRWITVVAGLVAITMALVDIKDFVVPDRGPSLSIPASAKPPLFARMRRLVRAGSWGSMVLGTIVLAAAANTYELLCTAGFPMVYTRMLTLAELSMGSYYLYLALYNLIYVVPLVVIVTIFVVTLGSRKLQEHEGRTLKLLSGLMMLGLGTTLVFAPERLSSLGTSLALMGGAGLLTAIALRVESWRRSRSARGEPPTAEAPDEPDSGEDETS